MLERIGTPGPTSVPDTPRPMSHDALRTRLEEAAHGLTYASESDRPFEFVRLRGTTTAIAALHPADLAALLGTPQAPCAESALDRVMARHLSGVDPSDTEAKALVPRYDALVRTLVESLPGLRVFRVGEVEVRILFLGNDPANGELAGLGTVAVET